GELLHQSHLLHYAVIAACQWLARPFAADMFGELSIAMRICTVAALLVFHYTLVTVGCTRAQRLLALVLLGGTGAVLFYATAIERQAPFLPFAALAFHALVRCAEAPGAARGAWLGVAIGGATLVHATGHLLFALAAPWLLLARGRAGMRAAVGALAVAAVVHVGVVLSAVGLAALAGGPEALQSQAQHIAFFADLAWQHLGFNLWREWLLPLLPGSVLLPVAALLRRTRRPALAVLIAWLPYQAFTFVTLRDFDERGAYLAPLALPLTLVLVRMLPVAALAAAAVVALGTGIGLNREYANAQPEQPTAAQVDEVLNGGRAVVLFVGSWSLRPILRHRPGIATVNLLGLSIAAPFEEACAAFDRGFRTAREAGFTAIISAQCLADMERDDLPRAARRFFREHFLVRYRFAPHRTAGYAYATVTERTD
ncbi:MAG TPA: hypothetical protein VK081_01840, partial [Planctomycetota bacterium]|nr:hypothetical protein [Planctomycetota bacterium]